MYTHLDAMLKTIKLPTGISNLNAGLANVDRKALSHGLVTVAEFNCHIEAD
jgi:hypothetical protein